jgi:hypothetical protein
MIPASSALRLIVEGPGVARLGDRGGVAGSKLREKRDGVACALVSECLAFLAAL